MHAGIGSSPALNKTSGRKWTDLSFSASCQKIENNFFTVQEYIAHITAWTLYLPTRLRGVSDVSSLCPAAQGEPLDKNTLGQLTQLHLSTMLECTYYWVRICEQGYNFSYCKHEF